MPHDHHDHNDCPAPTEAAPSGFQYICVPGHYDLHTENGHSHYDFDHAHNGLIKAGSQPKFPDSDPPFAAPSGYQWIGIPGHRDTEHIDDGHTDWEDPHWGLINNEH